jgi:hypothetical protein
VRSRGTQLETSGSNSTELSYLGDIRLKYSTSGKRSRVVMRRTTKYRERATRRRLDATCSRPARTSADQPCRRDLNCKPLLYISHAVYVAGSMLGSMLGFRDNASTTGPRQDSKREMAVCSRVGFRLWFLQRLRCKLPPVAGIGDALQTAPP